MAPVPASYRFVASVKILHVAVNEVPARSRSCRSSAGWCPKNPARQIQGLPAGLPWNHDCGRHLIESEVIALKSMKLTHPRIRSFFCIENPSSKVCRSPPCDYRDACAQPWWMHPIGGFFG